MKHVFPADLVKVESPVTPQTIFDLVVGHYRAHPRRCPPHGECRYEGDEGDKCWVRPLLGQHYVEEIEGRPIRDVVNLFPLPVWFRVHLDFIEALQRIHDDELNWTPGVMPVVLEMFAAERGLRMPA